MLGPVAVDPVTYATYVALVTPWLPYCLAAITFVGVVVGSVLGLVRAALGDSANEISD